MISGQTSGNTVKYDITKTVPEKQRSGCTVVGVFEGRKLTAAAKRIDKSTGGSLGRILRCGDIEGKPGQTLLLHNLAGIAAERVLLVGCGDRGDIADNTFRKVVASAIRALDSTGARDAVVNLSEEVASRDHYWAVRQIVEQSHDVLYRFEQLKSDQESPPRTLKKIALGIPKPTNISATKHAVREGIAIGNGVTLARDLGNLPANICTPTYLAERARALTKSSSAFKLRVLGEAEMKRLRMETLLSVARGSREKAKLIALEYKGAAKSQKPVVLVGKGVTFDSGGISIKPAAAMDEMKFDMCGAASVLGTLRAVVELELPINVTGIIPATENLPGGEASKPGDIVTSMSGQTVEVLNTDAEGRLILSDALTYARRFKPDVVIDIATLTGACVVALGGEASGLFTNDESLGDKLIEAGQYTGDRTWRLPLWEEYQDDLKSNFADFANVGGREAGAITAACFLARFTKEYRWAHMDIAGTAWKTGKLKGATGRPVPLLTQYLINRATPNTAR